MRKEMLKSFQALGCLMSLKVHFQHFHLNCFPKNVGVWVIEDISEMEMKIQGRSTLSIMVDYSWTLHTDLLEAY